MGGRIGRAVIPSHVVVSIRCVFPRMYNLHAVVHRLHNLHSVKVGMPSLESTVCLNNVIV